MSLYSEIQKAIIKTSRSAWGITGTLVMFVSPIASLAFRGRVPPELSDMLPYIVMISAGVLMFTAWLLSYAWQALFAQPHQVDVPELETVIYPAYPYDADSNLRTLSEFARKVFGGDTIDADIVQYAVAENCALGIRLTDQAGHNVGFFDVFRLRKNALLAWLDGHLTEPELKRTDFEPLLLPPADGKAVELIVGAIYIDPRVSKQEPSLAFQFAELAQSYLWKACPGWVEIRLFASIFSKPGERLAALYGFRRSINKEHRKGAGAQHDVWVHTLRRNDLPRMVRGLGGHHNVVVEMHDH